MILQTIFDSHVRRVFCVPRTMIFPPSMVTFTGFTATARIMALALKNSIHLVNWGLRVCSALAIDTCWAVLPSRGFHGRFLYFPCLGQQEDFKRLEHRGAVL